uniref:Polyprotein protein n=1 Tax=Solanum tuberosum TaxID=4113 RepID=M1DLA9_SOLTU
MAVDSKFPPDTNGDEVATAQSEAETDEEQLRLTEETTYEGLTEDEEAMVHFVVQISLADTSMTGSSRASVGVTPGTDADDQRIWVEEQSKDTNMQKGTKQAKRMKKGKPGDRQGPLANRQMFI